LWTTRRTARPSSSRPRASEGDVAQQASSGSAPARGAKLLPPPPPPRSSAACSWRRYPSRRVFARAPLTGAAIASRSPASLRSETGGAFVLISVKRSSAVSMWLGISSQPHVAARPRGPSSALRMRWPTVGRGLHLLLSVLAARFRPLYFPVTSSLTSLRSAGSAKCGGRRPDQPCRWSVSRVAVASPEGNGYCRSNAPSRACRPICSRRSRSASTSRSRITHLARVFQPDRLREPALRGGPPRSSSLLLALGLRAGAPRSQSSVAPGSDSILVCAPR